MKRISRARTARPGRGRHRTSHGGAGGLLLAGGGAALLWLLWPSTAGATAVPESGVGTGAGDGTAFFTSPLGKLLVGLGLTTAVKAAPSVFSTVGSWIDTLASPAAVLPAAAALSTVPPAAQATYDALVASGYPPAEAALSAYGTTTSGVTQTPPVGAIGEILEQVTSFVAPAAGEVAAATAAAGIETAGGMFAADVAAISGTTGAAAEALAFSTGGVGFIEGASAGAGLVAEFGAPVVAAEVAAETGAVAATGAFAGVGAAAAIAAIPLMLVSILRLIFPDKSDERMADATQNAWNYLTANPDRALAIAENPFVLHPEYWPAPKNVLQGEAANNTFYAVVTAMIALPTTGAWGEVRAKFLSHFPSTVSRETIIASIALAVNPQFPGWTEPDPFSSEWLDRSAAGLVPEVQWESR